MRLALAFGSPVAELKRRMAYSEFVRWQEYHQHEPLGAAHHDLLMAGLMALLANLQRDPKQRRQPYDSSDFLPDWWQERRPRNLAEKFRAISQVINARSE